MKLKFMLVLLLSVIIVRPCFGYENVTQVGRYLTLENKARLSQIELLSQTIQLRFPQNIQTIHEAMTYLLRFSGYDLVPINHMNKEIQITLSKSLPLVDRDLGPIPLKDALTILAGPAFVLMQDPINRTVDFRLKPCFQKSYRTFKGKKYL